MAARWMPNVVSAYSNGNVRWLVGKQEPGAQGPALDTRQITVSSKREENSGLLRRSRKFVRGPANPPGCADYKQVKCFLSFFLRVQS